MGASLHDPALIHHDDLVGVSDGRKPMGDVKGGVPARELAKITLNLALGMTVQGGGRFVEQQDTGIFQHGARDRHPLALATGQLKSTLSHHRLVPIWQAHDELVDVGQPCSFLDFGRARGGTSVADVVVQSVIKQHRVLRDDADGGAKSCLGDISNVLTIDRDAAFINLIKSIEKPTHRRFPGPGLTDKGDAFSRRLDDYVAKDNAVRGVEAFVDWLDLQGLGFSRTEDKVTGRFAYHASTLLKIYIYGYLNRIGSSRRLELECRRNVEMMWLTQRLAPDHKTIAEFRKDNGKAIVGVCREFVGVCHRFSLLADAQVAIDGSKFKAVNNRDKNFTDAKMKRRQEGIEKAIAHYLNELDEADRTEPEVARVNVVAIQDRLDKLNEEKVKLTAYAQALEASPDKQLSLTDPDSRAMKTRGSAVVGYNVQTVVDTTNHLIVAHEVVNDCVDRTLLSPMAHMGVDAMGTSQLEVLSDRGYYKGPEIVACEEAGIRTYVPKPQTSSGRKRGRFTKQDFVYDAEHDRYRCPAGAHLTRRYETVESGLTQHVYFAASSACGGCAIRAQCTSTSAPEVRRLKRWEQEAVLDVMQARLDRAPEKMQLRRQTVEHPFGTIKAWMGYTHFLTKTLPKVRAEMSLQVLAYNMKRVMNLIGVGALLEGLGAA